MSADLIASLAPEAVPTAVNHLRDILRFAFEHSVRQAALVVYDTQCALADILAASYRQVLPTASFIEFYPEKTDAIFSAFELLTAHDLVVLIQSTHFRLQDFRIRVQLFERAIKVIEHPHLARMSGIEASYYIDSLAYDVNYYRGVGYALKNMIDNAKRVDIISGCESLVFAGGLEPAKLNIGDYHGMKNIGGQFPIGEVFTEARDLEKVCGRVRIFAFADCDFKVNKPEQPITLVIGKGQVVAVENTTVAFEAVLTKIRQDENVVWLRELGFGMNRAFSQDRIVCDVGTYERMYGIHLSLGAKHSVYKKPHLRTRDTRHHVDVFVLTDQVYLDGLAMYGELGWVVNNRSNLNL